MPLFSNSVSDERTAVGIELLEYLTRDACDLAPRLSALTPAGAEALIAQAARHGVGPSLRKRLVEQGLFDALPAVARDELDAQYVDGTARAMARYHELGILLDRLADAGIPVIALKGIYLARAVYPEPGLRPMSDMDLLFREQDLERVQWLLLQLGYTREDVDRPIADYLPVRHQLPSFERPGATCIEVHMRIERPSAGFSIDHTGLWERARHWPLGGRPLLALSPEDLLLHLCLHGMYHHGFRVGLSALTDIARVVRVEPLAWDSFVERAGCWRASSTAFYGLELARRMLGAEVPDAVLSALTPREGADAALALAERTILAERPEDRRHDLVKTEQASPIGYLQIMDQTRALSGWRAKLGFVLPYVFPSRAVLEEKYPRLAGSGWVGLMRGLHWLVVLARFARGMAVNRRYWLTLRRLDRQ